VAGLEVEWARVPEGLTLDVTVHLSREVQWRFRIARFLLGLVAWVLACEVVVGVTHEDL